MRIYTDSIIVNSPLQFISEHTPQSEDFVPGAIDEHSNFELKKIDSIIIRNNCSMSNIVSLYIYN